METVNRTRSVEPKLYRVTGAGDPRYVKALTKAGAVNAVANLIASEPLGPVDVIELGITADVVIDATVTPPIYPQPKAAYAAADEG